MIDAAGALTGWIHKAVLFSIKTDFSLGALLVEVVTSWVTLGALFGALLVNIKCMAAPSST